MKIVFCNFNNGVYKYASGDPSAVGGAERQQWFLARGLVAAGWSVIVGVQGIPELASGTVIEGVRFVSLTGKQTSSTISHRLRCLYQFLRSELPDWLYWRCASHLWGAAVGIAKIVGVRTIFAAGFDTDVRPRYALAERPKCWPLYAWGLAKSDRIFVQHSGQFSALAAKLRSKAFVVPNMIDIHSTTKPHRERQRYIAWVGMLRQPKRPDLVVEIARRAPDLRFIVCGGPSDHRSPNDYGTRNVAALKSLPNVEYRGQVAPDEAHEIIANASVLLCTSAGEGFPNIFLEAWASGTPVVSLTVDPDHVIDRKKLGAVSTTIEAAIADLANLLDRPVLREEIALRCRQHVAEAHSEPAVMAEVIHALNEEECLKHLCAVRSG